MSLFSFKTRKRREVKMQINKEEGGGVQANEFPSIKER